MWAASSLIRRFSPSGSPQRTTPWLRMRGLALLARERSGEAGEEIVMVAGRQEPEYA